MNEFENCPFLGLLMRFRNPVRAGAEATEAEGEEPEDGSGGVWLVGQQGSSVSKLGLGSYCLSLYVPYGTCGSWSTSTHPNGDCPFECGGSTSGTTGYNFLARIDASGNVVYATSFGSASSSPGLDSAQAASDSSGNLFVVAKTSSSGLTYYAGSHTVSTWRPSLADRPASSNHSNTGNPEVMPKLLRGLGQRKSTRAGISEGLGDIW